MKKLFAVCLFGCVLAFTGCTGEFVATRPADVVYDRPVAPGADYIWIEGDWIWGGGSYSWHPGHWDRPRSGRTWTSGHWEGHGKGYRWRRGHW